MVTGVSMGMEEYSFWGHIISFQPCMSERMDGGIPRIPAWKHDTNSNTIFKIETYHQFGA
jgi:hypothetical protein